jgi:hypothetical protein
MDIRMDSSHIIKKNYRQFVEYAKRDNLFNLFDSLYLCDDHKDDFWLIYILNSFRTDSNLIYLLGKIGRSNNKSMNLSLKIRIEHNILNMLETLARIDYDENDNEEREEPLLFWKHKTLSLYSSFFQYSGYWHAYYAMFEENIKFDLRLSPHVLHSHLICAEKILEEKFKDHVPVIIRTILWMAC